LTRPQWDFPLFAVDMASSLEVLHAAACQGRNEVN
jgi:hypothetical protein